MREIKLWFGQHPNVVIAALVCVTVGIVAAMYFRYDLSWLPAVLVRAIWGGK